MGDAGFRVGGDKVKDCCTGCFGTGSRGGGNADKREEFFGDGEAFA